MKKKLLVSLSLAAVGCICLLAVIAAGYKEYEVMWIGHPMVSDNDRWTPKQSWLPEYQIGLRDDGVVVWKKIETGTNQPSLSK